MPPITLWFLQASRCIRVAWLLEELNLDYAVEFSPRVNQRAPDDFKKRSGNPLGKFPVLQDGPLTISESGAIVEYLCETYDKKDTMIPSQPVQARIAVRQWLHAAEATFAIHGLAILYARSSVPSNASDGTIEAMEKVLANSVQKDLSWLESELVQSGSKFLCGDHVTAADVMMQFSVDFILKRELGTKGMQWPHVEKWLQNCKETDGYKRAVAKTGHEL